MSRSPSALFAAALACLLAGAVLPAPAGAQQLVARRTPVLTYPSGESGTVDVTVQVTLDETGAVTAAEIVARSPPEASPRFDEAALAFARGLAFEPVVVGGKASAVVSRLELHFEPPVGGLEGASGAVAEHHGHGHVERPHLALPQTQRPPYPAGASGVVDVVVDVELDEHGHVVDASVRGKVPADAPAAFDAAALAFVRALTFEASGTGAGHRSGDLHLHFEPPPPTPPGASPAAPEPEPTVDERTFGATVRTRRTPADRAASDFEVEREVLAAAPHASAGDLLVTAPGVYVSRPEGDAVAQEIFLRGFDAEHGQDIELSVGPVPVNLPSHVHGQGYADLNFVIPETVRSIRVTEGVYDPRQGDFAVAGSANFDLGVTDRGLQARSSLGSFGTQRHLVLWAPPGEAAETFGAVALRRTDGFGQNRGAESGSALGQFAFDLPAGLRGLAHVAAYGGRASLPGLLRRDDVEAGRVDFYGSYPDPGANAQSALSTRTQAALTLERPGNGGSRTALSLWWARTDFRLRANYTGYLERSRERPAWVGRGDLVEQSQDQTSIGARLLHRTPLLTPLDGLAGRVELGFAFRGDDLVQQQNLLQAPQNETWDRRVDATVGATDIGAWVDADFRFSTVLRLRGGLRADALGYDVDDRLGNFTPSVGRETHLPGFRRTAFGVAAGPRVSLEYAPVPVLRVVGSYGEGFRSPQARQLEEGEQAPFTKVRSGEVGLEWRPDEDRLRVTAAAFSTALSSDLAFDPGSASLQRVGPTSRRGAVVHVLAHPWSWLTASASATYVLATLDAPPPATAADPNPPFEPGQLLPYVPPLTVRADVGATRTLGDLFGAPLGGRLGLGFSALSPRPLPYGRFAEPVALLDATAALSWRFVDLSLDVTNALDARYAASEYAFVSDWQTRDVPSLVPARHFAAGPPRALLATVGLRF